MKLARLLGGRVPERTRPRLEDRYRDIIARLCPGKSFIDVGCLWAIHGEYAFYAAENGSPRVVGFDVNEATPEFHARNTALGNRVGFIRGDLNASSFPGQVGTFDIVFCVSVLHHMPNPVAALLQLRRVCGEAAIIGVPTIPERDLPHSAIYLPFLDPTERQKVLKALSTSVYRTGKTAEFQGGRTYVNWFWCFTPSCVKAMFKTAGFDLVDAYEYPRFGCYVLRPNDLGLPLEGAGDPGFHSHRRP